MDATARARYPRSILKTDAYSSAYAGKIALSLAGVFIAAYFLWFTRQGIHRYFTSDDMMNLYWYWTAPNWKLLKSNILYFSPEYRPLGALFYKPIFALAGFDPVPFRLVIYGILLVNLFLNYSVARRLAGSREAGILATFLGAYQLSFGALYYNAGTIYDVLCFTFYFSALLYYLKIRQAGRPLSAAQIAILCVLYIAALDAKEMAVTLPVALGMYDFFYASSFSWRALLRREWILGSLLPMWVTGFLTVPYMIGKMGSPALTSPGYAASYSISDYWDHLQVYLNDFCAGKFHSMWIFPAMIVAAWLLRSPALRFGIMFLLVSMLPIAFVVPRTTYVLYMPLVGATLYIATLLMKIRERLVSAARLSPGAVQWSPAILFVAVAVLFVRMNARSRSPSIDETSYEQPRIRSYVQQLRSRYAELPNGTRILLVDDPDWMNQWTPYFIISLLYRDTELHIERTGHANSEQLGAFDLVLTSAHERLIEVRRKAAAEARGHGAREPAR